MWNSIDFMEKPNRKADSGRQRGKGKGRRTKKEEEKEEIEQESVVVCEIIRIRFGDHVVKVEQN